MGFYDTQVLPRAIDVMLGSKAFGREVRGAACAGLHGDVIELGFGSGLNLLYLPPEVTGVWTVDPSAVGMKLAQKRIAASPVPVHEGGLDGARLDFPDDRFDAALHQGPEGVELHVHRPGAEPGVTRLILHITTAPEWKAAAATGEYRAPSLESEGFIHCSTPVQVVHVGDWFYRDVPDLVLLCIDADALTSELLWEASSDSFAGEFPHVYGPISVGAVRAVVPWARGDDGFAVPVEVEELEEL